MRICVHVFTRTVPAIVVVECATGRYFRTHSFAHNLPGIDDVISVVWGNELGSALKRTDLIEHT